MFISIVLLGKANFCRDVFAAIINSQPFSGFVPLLNAIGSME